MERIIVIGSSCAGKSTFARELSQKLGYEYIQLDELHWLPNWQEQTAEEFRKIVSEKINSDRWVLDGNYSVVKDITWPLATDIVWLNYSFSTVLYRALKRSVIRAATKEELFSGNVETFRQSFFSKDSIIWWVITTFHDKRKRYPVLLGSNLASGANIVEFNKTSEASRWLSLVSVTK